MERDALEVEEDEQDTLEVDGCMERDTLEVDGWMMGWVAYDTVFDCT